MKSQILKPQLSTKNSKVVDIDELRQKNEQLDASLK